MAHVAGTSAGALIASQAMRGINDEPKLGLTRDQVEVADSDPRWKLVFDGLSAQLRTALADLDATVEHVGSTSVPGLAAKPIIDIAIGVRGPMAIGRIIKILEPLGYIYRRDEGSSGGQLFVVDDDNSPWHRIAYIHVVATDDPQWFRYLGFRDRLREDPQARDEYQQLKRRLAAEFPNDRIGYTTAKESFIEGLLSTNEH
jgi:GrpB-like predicted nucleotidyltransferase (UPF0157 family)